ATHDGHRLAVVLLILAAVAAAPVWVQSGIEASVSIPPAMRRAYVAARVLALAAVLSVVDARSGSPDSDPARSRTRRSTPDADRPGRTRTPSTNDRCGRRVLCRVPGPRGH